MMLACKKNNRAFVSAGKPLHGFTLIELLVVISIIALLLSILMPALNKVKKQAIKVVCATNLRQWGIAWIGYASDSNGSLPSTYMDSTNKPWPNAVLTPDVYVAHPTIPKGTYIDVQMVADYIGGVNFENKKIDESVWLCPGQKKQLLSILGDWWKAYGSFNSNYTYFGQVRKWSKTSLDSARLERDLANKSTDRGSKLLMSDILMYANSGSPDGEGWWYNHGESGPSWGHSYRGVSIKTDPGPPQISGANQLYIDGHVEWKGKNKFDIEGMQRPDKPFDATPFINSRGLQTVVTY